MQLVPLLCSGTTLFSEVVSNTATATIMLPMMAQLAVEMHLHPLLLMLPVTCSCSLVFMLPCATPPNAIAYGTKLFGVGHMMRVGYLLDLVGVCVCSMLMFVFGGYLLGIQIYTQPDWASVSNLLVETTNSSYNSSRI